MRRSATRAEAVRAIRDRLDPTRPPDPWSDAPDDGEPEPEHADRGQEQDALNAYERHFDRMGGSL